MSESKNLWGGRFRGETDPGFARFNRSFGFDRRLFEADVRGSLAHCEGLRAAGGLGRGKASQALVGLRAARRPRAGEPPRVLGDRAADDVRPALESAPLGRV